MRTAFSSRYDAALTFAALAHHGQVRKGTQVPYLVHPVQVSRILGRHGFDEDLQIAGLLHDTVEDTGIGLLELEAAFGPEVARLVDAVTEVKTDGDERRPWRTRKEEQLAHLASADARVAALKAADSLHNSSTTLVDLRLHGPSIWERFNASAAESLWYYGEVATLVASRLGDHPLALELRATVDEMTALSA
jgi:(p)ppGpp synthase/HD superfamily hydrolase